MFANEQIAAGYVGGLIDGEGSIDATPKHRCIRMSNTDPAIIAAYEQALDALGIQHRTTNVSVRAGHKPAQMVTIWGRRNLERVRDVVPLAAPAKRKRLEELCASFVLPHYYRKHEITRERLVELVARGLTQREIASDLGLKCHSNAQHHLEKHGLRTQRACGLL